VNPLIDTKIPGPDKKGIYQIRLGDYNASLKPGIVYECYLSIILDEKERSGDFAAGAAIQYVPSSDVLSKSMSGTPEDKLYYGYAQAGYWYDAIGDLSRRIANDSEDETLKQHRASLLKQVNIVIEN
jgi:hypothetical protein